MYHAISINVREKKQKCSALQAVQDPVRPAEQPIELSFQEGYGDIEQHLWFGEGYILIGFTTGVPSMVAGPTCSMVAAEPS